MLVREKRGMKGETLWKIVDNGEIRFRGWIVGRELIGLLLLAVSCDVQAAV